MRVVGCFLEYNGKFVILLRHSHKPDGNTWGLPGGKVEAGESDTAATVRELYEETGYQPDSKQLQHIGNFDFVSSRGQAYTYVAYRLTLQQPIDIRLEAGSHSAYEWVSPEECYAKQDLITDLDSLLRLIGYVH